MKIRTLPLLFSFLILSMWIFTSCSVLQQTSEMKNFGKCDFRIESARNMKLGGVSMQDKTSISQVGILEITKIGAAVASGSLPLTFDLNITAKNPNPTLAAMNKLDWILIIDDAEMTRGVLNQRVEIPANSTSQFPVAINFDLMKSLNGKSADALINFVLNLAGTGTKPTRIKLKAKPTILIGSAPLEYPGYITIRQEFGAQ
ncbi:MAG: hypothetical protein RBS55_12535 [Bacteroidales bacterium]|nr:hypothetical protein [Bacteroidales bacterium]